jgi:hypothetical protein
VKRCRNEVVVKGWMAGWGGWLVEVGGSLGGKKRAEGKKREEGEEKLFRILGDEPQSQQTGFAKPTIQRPFPIENASPNE